MGDAPVASARLPMNAALQERWADVIRVVDQALDLAPTGRSDFVGRSCSGDPVLRAEVERLLHATACAGPDFLEHGAAADAAPLLAWVARQGLAAGTRFGAYEVTGLLGRGGMATVYLAQDLKHHRRVAVKVLHAEVSAAVGREWFLREIDIAAALHHPHILPLHDSGSFDGLLYYVMPHVEGESLRQRLAREGPLSLASAQRIVREVAGALDYAHRQGVVHRDIKPENILLQDGQAIVADFGIARAITTGAVDAGTTDTIPAIGTPAYMSPEQATGSGGLDGRSDVYALGCVLYEMMAGQPPFSGPTTQAILDQHSAAPVPSLRAARPDAPLPLEKAITRALQKSPADRFATAGEFVEAIDVAATGPGTRRAGNRVLKWIPTRRRNWLVAAVAGLAILAAGLAAVLAGEPHELEPSRVLVERADPLAAEDLRSIAVLPLVNLSPDKEDEYFSDGMTVELINALGKVEGLRVAARASAFAFKGKSADPRDVSEKLHVAAVLDGSVRKAGNRLRVSVELVSARDGRRLWFDTYDRTLTDVFSVQEEVARAITGALKLRLATSAGTPVVTRPTDDLEAYKLYLQGRYYSYSFEGEKRRRAVEYFRKAVERDPGYALAWAGLADGYSLMAMALSRREIPAVREHARAAALRAVALDSTLAEAHAALGDIQYYFDWNWGPAERSLRRAIALNPNNALTHRWYSELLTILGRYPEAVVEAKRAELLDPLNPFMVLGTIWAHFTARQYESAGEAARRWIELDSTSVGGYMSLGRAQLLEGRQNEAFANLGTGAKLSKPDPHSQLGLVLAYAYATTGQREKARGILRGVQRETGRAWPPSTDFAAAYAALEDFDGALGWLERGYAAHEDDIPFIAAQPWLDPLRGDPRFARLLRRMRLPT